MSANADRFDCATCSWGRHCDADLKWPGSRGPAPIAQWVIDGVLDSKTCLLPMITPLSRRLLSLYSHYKNSLLPLTGGVTDQPAAFLEAMEIIDSRFNRLQRERTKKR